jgi:6-phosphogluconolactonase (cycloisomerase 2 family)
VRSVAVSNARNLLFASNSVSNDVSVFSINSNNGSLTFVGRFPTGGLAGICSNNDISGISLTVTPDDRFLMAGNAGSNDVTVFSVAGDGSLTPISGSPFSAGGTPDGMKISANGAFLGIGLTQPVGVLSIAQSGTVTPAPGSPFQGSGADSGVDIKCSGNQLFAGNATSGTTIIDVFDFPANGSLSPIAGSPFQPGVGVNSNGVLLSPHGQFLFVSNQGTGTGDDTITVFRVAANGSLTLVPGSPFAVGSNGATPTLMATNQAGTFLFVANTPADDTSLERETPQRQGRPRRPSEFFR